MLRQVLSSYSRLSSPIELIVHDNGSDDPATLHVLHKLSCQGVAVSNGRKVRTASDLHSVNETIYRYFRGAPSTRYVVTDCDVDMSIADSDALRIYGELLDQFPAAEVVGPMLKVRDIPREYPLFNRVINRHQWFWRRPPDWAETSAGRTAIVPAPIDTTFALHREGMPFRRLKQGIRVCCPYEARHLDWYVSHTQARASSYHHTSAADISHWNNASQHQTHGDERLRNGRIIYVERDPGGRLIIRCLALEQRPLD